MLSGLGSGSVQLHSGSAAVGSISGPGGGGGIRAATLASAPPDSSDQSCRAFSPEMPCAAAGEARYLHTQQSPHPHTRRCCERARLTKQSDTEIRQNRGNQTMVWAWRDFYGHYEWQAEIAPPATASSPSKYLKAYITFSLYTYKTIHITAADKNTYIM